LNLALFLLLPGFEFRKTFRLLVGVRLSGLGLDSRRLSRVVRYVGFDEGIRGTDVVMAGPASVVGGRVAVAAR